MRFTSFRRSMTFLSSSILLVLTACSDDKNPVQQQPPYDFATILNDYTNKVVVATYADLRDKAAALNTLVVDFANDPTNQTKLDAAANAWKSARVPWEASEGFLFGPVAFLSLDPSLDSWPVDEQQLTGVLASNFSLTPEFIATGLGPALRGFHTIEYLLFHDGQPRQAAQITSREHEYLVAATQVLADDAQALWEAWDSGFAEEFSNAGKQGSRYKTQNEAIHEIVEGMITICDEVANGKIADPVNQQDARLVESQFAWNSLADFQNNLRSVQNAYTGGYHNAQDGQGLDVFVASKNSTLDTRLKAEIQDAIDKIGQIPFPFRNNLNAAAQITAAQQAINKVATTLSENVKPLLTE